MMPSTRATPATHDTSDSGAQVSTLNEFFRHLSRGDAHAAAALWDVPALILGDEHAHGPMSRDRLAEVLADMPGPAPLEARPSVEGDAPIELSIDRVEWTSQRVALVEARWRPLPRGGLLHGIEVATFLLRSDELGHPKIRGLLLHSARHA